MGRTIALVLMEHSGVSGLGPCPWSLALVIVGHGRVCFDPCVNSPGQTSHVGHVRPSSCLPLQHVPGTKSDSETALYSETSLQKLFCCIRKLFRCIQKLLYSETISSYSETLFVVFRNYFVVFRNYFVVFRNYFRRIQKLFSSYSETIFVVFRNYVRRIQKLLFLMLRNFYSRTRGQCEQSHAWTVDAFSCIQGGVGGLGWGSKLP